MSEQERKQEDETEREETIEDLDVSAQEGKDVKGGGYDLKANKKI